MTDANPEPKPSLKQALRLALPLAVLYGCILYILIWGYPRGDMPLFSGLVLFPAALGSVGVILADPRGRAGADQHTMVAFATAGICLAISVVFFNEGTICVLMGSPLILAFSAIGSMLTGAILRVVPRNRVHTLVVILLPFLGLPYDYNGYPDHFGEVRTVIDIRAPRDVVWRHTVEIPQIDRSELPWTFSHGVVGLPQPVDAKMNGAGVGAVRDLQWTRNVRFQEVVTEWEENRSLGWNFRFSADSIPAEIDEHIKIGSDYLDIATGDYRLEDLPGGLTRLTLTTRYRIATPMNAYFAAWGHILLNDFHSVVLNVIQERSERAAQIAGQGLSR